MSKLFLLEDDNALITGLNYSLKKEGYEVTVARTVLEARQSRKKDDFDLMILDVNLPDGSGFDFCKEVRTESDIPIIFLTALDEEMNIIMGLDMGGDDYIAKPFKIGVLLSRVNALLRRSKRNESTQKTVLESNGIKVSLLDGNVTKNGKTIELSGGEYKLLCLFMQNTGRILTKDRILENLWDIEGNYIDSSALTVYVRRLRIKIEDDPANPKFLLTIRGMGYKWSVENESIC